MFVANDFFHKRARRAIAAALLLVVTTCGCGPQDWGYVTGTVMVDGEPVGPGTLLWEPIDPVSKTAGVAIAHFAQGGVYVLKSAGNREGASAGKYRIMVRSGSEADFTDENDEQVDPNETSMIPARYQDYESANLTRTIRLGQNRIDFDLTP